MKPIKIFTLPSKEKRVDDASNEVFHELCMKEHGEELKFVLENDIALDVIHVVKLKFHESYTRLEINPIGSYNDNLTEVYLTRVKVN